MPFDANGRPSAFAFVLVSSMPSGVSGADFNRLSDPLVLPFPLTWSHHTPSLCDILSIHHQHHTSLTTLSKVCTPHIHLVVQRHPSRTQEWFNLMRFPIYPASFSPRPRHVSIMISFLFHYRVSLSWIMPCQPFPGFRLARTSPVEFQHNGLRISSSHLSLARHWLHSSSFHLNLFPIHLDQFSQDTPKIPTLYPFLFLSACNHRLRTVLFLAVTLFFLNYLVLSSAIKFSIHLPSISLIFSRSLRAIDSESCLLSVSSLLVGSFLFHT